MKAELTSQKHTPELYQVHWKTAGGFGGVGKPLPKDIAQAWADSENKVWKDEVKHWIEPAKAEVHS